MTDPKKLCTMTCNASAPRKSVQRNHFRVQLSGFLKPKSYVTRRKKRTKAIVANRIIYYDMFGLKTGILVQQNTRTDEKSEKSLTLWRIWYDEKEKQPTNEEEDEAGEDGKIQHEVSPQYHYHDNIYVIQNELNSFLPFVDVHLISLFHCCLQLSPIYDIYIYITVHNNLHDSFATKWIAYSEK